MAQPIYRLGYETGLFKWETPKVAPWNDFRSLEAVSGAAQKLGDDLAGLLAALGGDSL
jgi:hypothetical protein